MIYILDIETKPNKKFLDLCSESITAPSHYKDPKKIQNYVKEKRKEIEKKMATDSDYCKIFCIGLKPLGQESKIITIFDLAKILEEDESWTLVTFNGKKFDLPIIIKQGIIKKVKLPYRELMMGCRRYDTSRHIDLFETLSFGNDWKSLDKYLSIYLGVRKEEINFKTAEDDEIIKHCLDDLKLTEALFQEFDALF